MTEKTRIAWTDSTYNPLMQQCAASGTAFFFKQHSSRYPGADDVLFATRTGSSLNRERSIDD